MQTTKKIAGLIVLALCFPVMWFVAHSFIISPSPEIYAFVPQEADLVVEVNTRNFAQEMMYQRVFEEDYFMSKVYGDEEDEREEHFQEKGMDPFQKVIMFREQWAGKSVWFLILKYTNQKQLETFILEQSPNAHFEYANGYAIVLLNGTEDTEALAKHHIKVSKKEIKPFTTRVNLFELFDPTKEINCFIVPDANKESPIIDGYLAFDFLEDRISISGDFSPVSSVSSLSPIAYKTQLDQALSLRSSLNLFRSAHWFNRKKIQGLPSYQQLALDYNGIDCYMVSKTAGYTTPYESFPRTQVHVEISDPAPWKAVMDSLVINGGATRDTTTNMYTLAEGVCFKYKITNRSFELMKDSVVLEPSNEEGVYFDLHIDANAMIDNINISVDEENPPGPLMQTAGMIVANDLLERLRSFSNVSTVDFKLTKSETNEDVIDANGSILMKEKEGHAMVESFFFGTATLVFLQNF